MANYNYESANGQVLKIIREKIEGFLKVGENAYNNGLTDSLVAIDETNSFYVLESDYENYGAANDFRTLLEFRGTYANTQLYEIPGMKVGKKVFPLIIPIEQAGVIAEKAHNIEKKLAFMGVKFPSQLYQLLPKYKGENLPGKDFPPPEPKVFSQTEAEYEKYLEEYYKAHGVDKSSDDTAFRLPYPHERINYGRGNKENAKYTNEYYDDQFVKAAKGKGTTVEAPVGSKIKVTAVEASDPTLGKDADQVKTKIHFGKVKSAALKIAAIGFGVVGAAALLHATPTGIAIVATAAATFALTRYLMKKYRLAKAKRKKGKDGEEEIEIEIPGEEPTKGIGKDKEHEDPGIDKGLGENPTGPTPVVPTATDPGKGTGATPTNPRPTDPAKGTGATPTTPRKPSSRKPSGSKPKGPAKPTGTTPVEPKPLGYDPNKVYDGEQELAFDNEAFRQINGEITQILIQLEPIKDTTDPAMKPNLVELNNRLRELYKQRLELIERIMSRQQIIMEDMGLSSKKR